MRSRSLESPEASDTMSIMHRTRIQRIKFSISPSTVPTSHLYSSYHPLLQVSIPLDEVPPHSLLSDLSAGRRGSI